MISEIATLILKLDSNALPFASVNLAFCFAVRVTSLHGLNEVTKLACNHPKKKHNALFVHRFMTETPEVNRISIGGAIVEFWVTLGRAALPGQICSWWGL
jgi:hypothetical protein